MRRTGFAPRTPRRAATQSTYSPRPRAVAVSDGKARMVVPIPKPEPCKPGKRTPTIEERRWLEAITAIGCIACRLDGYPDTPGDVHHILRGGRRIGHLFTLLLCPGHHRDGTGAPGLVARHPFKARFERLYGTEATLLHVTRLLVAPPPHGLWPEGVPRPTQGAA